MGVEIEHKWLPKEKLIRKIRERACPVHIEQAYLCKEPVIRVRQEGDSFYMTYKGKGFLEREEYNLPLTGEAYLSLKEKREGNIIIKDRYKIPFSKLYPDLRCGQKGPDGELLLEMDVFHGKQEGLILLEVEFATGKDAEDFRAPGEFGENVTGNPGYSNAVLSGKD